jgi:hypothetical protein
MRGPVEKLALRLGHGRHIVAGEKRFQFVRRDLFLATPAPDNARDIAPPERRNHVIAVRNVHFFGNGVIISPINGIWHENGFY